MAKRDDRFYVQVTLDVLSPTGKLAGAPTGAKWLWLAGLILSRRDLLDGLVRPAAAAVEAEVPVRHAKELDARGLWHNPGHDCGRCVQPPAGLMVIHDYLEHNQSLADVEALKVKRSEAGRKGAESRWHGNRDGKSHGKSHGTSDGTGQWQNDAVPMAESESETEPVVTSSRHLRSVPGDLSDDDLTKISNATGGDVDHAVRVATDILGRCVSAPRNPLAYVLRSVGDEPDRYRPTPRPPRADELCPVPGHSSRAGACIQCAADAKAAR